jgi:hypothetical protein
MRCRAAPNVSSGAERSSTVAVSIGTTASDQRDASGTNQQLLIRATPLLELVR